MRAKTLITILLALFVVVALGAIVMKSPAPEPQVERSAAEATSIVVETPAGDREADSLTAVPIAAPATTTQASPSVNAAEPPAAKSTEGAKPVSSTASAPPTQTLSKPVRRVVATYFHGNVRCTTCRKVEAYAREAVEEEFQTEVAAGTVEFRAVNLDEAQNAHFAQDYQLVNKSVVVTEELDGKVARWAKLDEVWSLVGNRDAYHHYVQDAVRGYLETE